MFTYVCVYGTCHLVLGGRLSALPPLCQECCFHVWGRYRMCRMGDSGSQLNQQRIVRRCLHIVDSLLLLITKSRDVSRPTKGHSSSCVRGSCRRKKIMSAKLLYYYLGRNTLKGGKLNEQNELCWKHFAEVILLNALKKKVIISMLHLFVWH